MSTTVCLCARTLDYPNGGGHLWVYLNWALGLRALGCNVIWLEPVQPDIPEDEVHGLVTSLKKKLMPFNLDESLALCSWTSEPLPSNVSQGCIYLEEAYKADLLLNLVYELPLNVVERFRWSALLDIDPGLLQMWMSEYETMVSKHDLYFTIGETVGRREARFPDVGIDWQYTPPCVALDYWSLGQTVKGAPFSTISHWQAEEWFVDESGSYQNDKRSGFLPFLNLPSYTTQPLELALCLEGDENEKGALQKQGWCIREAYEVSSTPKDYQNYIQSSLGEFSCAKPSCVRLQNAWISDRTLCYLASGKPAVVQHTGPSRFLPDDAGLFRFQDLREAVRYLEIAASDYDRQCHLARALAEEYFDAANVIRNVLERSIT